MDLEMHPNRWGDPARAADLPESARGLVELAFGLTDRPAVEQPPLPEPHLPAAAVAALTDLLGAEHVRLDDETRRLRTRGKSTPDLLRAREGDLVDAPDAVVRPASQEEVAR